ncbi:Ovate protein family, C-terminal [Dillenia turbinata]|uniref:Transcription repressor n=1 Tax=Dillenia turbinata TaxID=194707 RepID=A0AAN8ZL63_9MAGN
MSSSSPSSSSMENKFKLKLSRMFKSSFGSCKTRHITDVIEQQPVFISQTQIQEPVSPPPLLLKQRPSFASLCKPRSSVFAHQMFDQNCIRSRNYKFNGQKCPPASPVSPLNDYYYSSIQKYSKKQSKSKTHLRKQRKNHILNSNNGWFSSEDELEEEEDETETLFSSKSFSSDSSESFRRKKKSSRRRPPRHRRRRVRSEASEMRVSPFEVRNGKVKDSFAVVKRSSDPYNDFRTSMVEMIIEKQIFAAKDLEQLLQCFLSLNSGNHHRIIVEVFTEIYEALFSNWS